jgi:hypothetical protein
MRDTPLMALAINPMIHRYMAKRKADHAFVISLAFHLAFTTMLIMPSDLPCVHHIADQS